MNEKTFWSLVFFALMIGLALLERQRNKTGLFPLEAEFSRELVHPLYDGIIASSKMGRFIRLLLQ